LQYKVPYVIRKGQRFFEAAPWRRVSQNGDSMVWACSAGASGSGKSSAPRGAQALLLDRRPVEDRGAPLDRRLVALSFAVNALGKSRMRRRLPRRRLVRSNRGTCRV
jgi:hypothetical protein